MADAPDDYLLVVEFIHRRDGMIHAMNGGLWLHRHVWYGRELAHVVSTDRERLLAYGRHVGLAADRLQFKPLKDPRDAMRRAAWHWDVGGPALAALCALVEVRSSRDRSDGDSSAAESAQP